MGKKKNLRHISQNLMKKSKQPQTIKLASPSTNRRAISSLTACLVTLTITSTALAVTAVDLKDDRKVLANGFDLIYEARDLSLPQSVRDGLTQARGSVDDTKKRVVELKNYLNSESLSFIKKSILDKAKESLRLRVGTLRFDLNILVQTKSKAEKKYYGCEKTVFY